MLPPPRSLAGPLGLALVAILTAGVVAVFGSKQLQAAGGRGEAREASSLAQRETLRARAVAEQFFGSMARHDYAKVCTLLSAEYREANDVGDLCELQLNIAFTGRDLEFIVLDVEPARNRFRVRALANGSPGVLTLVREQGDYRVASMTDS